MVVNANYTQQTPTSIPEVYPNLAEGAEPALSLIISEPAAPLAVGESFTLTGLIENLSPIPRRAHNLMFLLIRPYFIPAAPVFPLKE